MEGSRGGLHVAICNRICILLASLQTRTCKPGRGWIRRDDVPVESIRCTGHHLPPHHDDGGDGSSMPEPPHSPPLRMTATRSTRQSALLASCPNTTCWWPRHHPAVLIRDLHQPGPQRVDTQAQLLNKYDTGTRLSPSGSFCPVQLLAFSQKSMMP